MERGLPTGEERDKSLSDEEAVPSNDNDEEDDLLDFKTVSL